jgi:hypothetical protein
MNDQHPGEQSSGASHLQRNSGGHRKATRRWSDPAVVAGILTAIATILAAVIGGVFPLLARGDAPAPAVVTASPLPPSPDVPDSPHVPNGTGGPSTSPARTGNGNVPEQRLGRWSGSAGYAFAKYAVNATIRQAQVGDPAGSLSYQFSGSDPCVYTLALIDVGDEFLEFQASRTKGSDVCFVSTVRLDFDGTEIARYIEDGQPAGTLHHSA